jgi:hypothetical protein
VTRAGVLAAIALLAGGCGGAGDQLFVVHRTGAIPGARLDLAVGDDGIAHCNGGPAQRIEDARLLDAREIARDLDDLPDHHLRLPPGRESILSYRVATPDGTLAFSDTSRGQPPVFFRLAQLTRQVARRSCGLRR